MTGGLGSFGKAARFQWHAPSPPPSITFCRTRDPMRNETRLARTVWPPVLPMRHAWHLGEDILSTTIRVQIRQLPHGEGLPLPAYQSAHTAGLDLLAAVAEAEPLTLSPGRHALVPTALAIALPEGFEAQVRPRSGLAAKHGVTVLNSPGTIDADYRGEIQVILINHGSEPFAIRRGERIAQMVIAPMVQVTLVPVTSLPETDRGSGGFGWTRPYNTE